MAEILSMSSLSAYDVWVPPVWLLLICAAIPRLLRTMVLKIMLTHGDKVNRVVDRIMFHHDGTRTLVSFLRSPDVVGIVKDYCGTRHRESYLYIYGRKSAIHCTKKSHRIYPDIENGLAAEVPKYYQEPTVIEDVTRQVVEADGVLILLRGFLSLVTVATIALYIYLDTDTHTLSDAMMRALMRFFNSGAVYSLIKLARMMIEVKKNTGLDRSVPTLVPLWILNRSLAFFACMCIILHIPYAMIHSILALPSSYVIKFLETIPYLEVKLFSWGDDHYKGYPAYVADLAMMPVVRMVVATSVTATLLWSQSSPSQWWDCAIYDFMRRVGFIVPMDTVSVLQLITFIL
jgi:hypothetical protein